LKRNLCSVWRDTKVCSIAVRCLMKVKPAKYLYSLVGFYCTSERHVSHHITAKEKQDAENH
jgi:hypothetical protein